jgi:hypothetical protein
MAKRVQLSPASRTRDQEGQSPCKPAPPPPPPGISRAGRCQRFEEAQRSR